MRRHVEFWESRTASTTPISVVSDPSTALWTNAFLLIVTSPEGEEVEHLLRGREITVGRDPSNRICIPHHFVSQFHAKIVQSGDTITVVDLGSANKTRVNGRPIVHKSLKEGDEIQFAGVSCRLTRSDPAASPLDRLTPSGKALPSAELKGSRLHVSNIYLSLAILLLFCLVAVLASRVC